MRKKGLKSIAVVLGFFLLSAMEALAANELRIAGSHTGEQEVSLYVKGIETEITSAECQIGTKAGQQVSYENIENMENVPKTLIMIDNSLSITEANREKIHNFLLEFVNNKYKNEKISIAVFNEGLNAALDYTEDAKALKLAVDAISYQDQDTYLTDVLYDVIANEHMGTEDCYKRIIIISDGVDNKAIGYTKDELYALIKEKAYPIYTVGCIYKDNNEQLENMFAISRMTGAKEFLLDDVENINAIVDEITADNHVIHFTITPEADEMDGSVKSILLTMQTAEGTQQIETQAKMPFGAQMQDPSIDVEPDVDAELAAIAEPDTDTDLVTIAEPNVDEGAVSTEEPSVSENAVDTADTTNMENTEESEESDISKLLIIIIVLAVCVIVVAVIIILFEKRSKGATDNFEVIPETVNTAPKVQIDETVMVTDGGSSGGGDGTRMIWGETAKQHILIMTDIKNPGRTFQMPIMDSVIIGRRQGDADLVIDYDKSVSGKHCAISERNGKFYVKDLQSSNGTKLNGTNILAEMELHSGAVLTMGRLEMKVEIR